MDPDFAMAHNDICILYYNQGDKEKALNHYEQAVRIESHNLTFQKKMADFYFVECGRVEDALAINNKVLEIDFGDVEALMSIGLICAALDRSEDTGCWKMNPGMWRSENSWKICRIHLQNPFDAQ